MQYQFHVFNHRRDYGCYRTRVHHSALHILRTDLYSWTQGEPREPLYSRFRLPEWAIRVFRRKVSYGQLSTFPWRRRDGHVRLGGRSALLIWCDVHLPGSRMHVPFVFVLYKVMSE